MMDTDGYFSPSKFKEEYYEAGEFDMIPQVPHLFRLAQLYIERARNKHLQQDNWINYITAHALLNSCLVQDDDIPTWHPKIYQLEYEFNQGNFPLSESEHLQLIIGMQQKLKNVKEELKARQSPVEDMVSELDTESEFSEENVEVLGRMNQCIFSNSDWCTREMLQFGARVMEASESIVGPPPCSYCAVALGSLARNEATPYSDLEYIFLIESEQHRNYFHKLAITSYLFINNLGETPLKCLYVEELHDHYGDGEKEERWFMEHTTSGFKIDGITPKAGHIPTGKGGVDNEVWIKTPEELTGCYSKFLKRKISRKTAVGGGDITDMLSSTVSMHTSGAGQALYEEFVSQREHWAKKFRNRKSMQAHMNALKLDLIKYDFIPDGDDSAKYAIKTDLFRYPTLLLHNLGIMQCMKSTSSHELLDELLQSDLITEDGHFLLSVLLSSALHVRTAAYLAFNSQREILSFLLQNEDEPPDRYYFPRELFVVMAIIMRAIKSALEKRDIMQTMKTLNKTSLYVINRCWKAEALYFCGDPTGYIAAIQQHFGITDLNDCVSNCKNVLKQSQQAIPQEDGLDLGFDNLALVTQSLSDLGETRLCIVYGEKILCIQQEYYYGLHTEIPKTLNHLAFCYSDTGDYVKASELYSQSLEIYKTMHGKNDHYDIANSLQHLGQTYQNKGDYYQAERYFTESLEMRKRLNEDTSAVLADLASFYCDTGRYTKAEKYYKLSFKMIERLYGNASAHPNISASLHDLAGFYLLTGKHHQAEHHYKKSLEIDRKLYRKRNYNSRTASTLANLGATYNSMGDYQQATDCYQQSRDMYKQLHGGTNRHPALAILLNNTGKNYGDMGNFQMAEKFYQESLIMKRAMFGETDHPDIASTVCNLGDAYENMGDYQEALTHYNMSLESSNSLYGRTNDHPYKAKIINNLGNTYRKLEDNHSAEKYYSKSLEMNERIYAETGKHPDIAETLNNLGELYSNMGDNIKAEHYCLKSLRMYKRIHGDKIDNPDIAKVTINLRTIHSQCSTAGSK